MDLTYSLAGLLVGFLVGLTGVGGGSLMAPLLILMFGFNPAVAVGTDLWFAAITKSAGGVIHRHVGSPDWQIIRRLAMGSVPAALATLLWLSLAQDGKLEAQVLLRLLGGALIFSACLMPMRTRFRASIWHIRERFGTRFGGHQAVATVVGGALIGVLVTLTSVGAGALVAVLLMVLYPLRLDTRSLVGTDIIHAIPLALVAAIGHSYLGNVDWLLLGTLLIGSIPGIIVGSLVAGKVNESLVRNALALVLALSGFKLLMS